MSLQLTIYDMKLKPISFNVDKSTTIGEIKKIFTSKGGDGGLNQWKYDGHILEDDNQKLEDIEGFDPEEMAMSVTTNVRGGPIQFTNVSKKQIKNLGFSSSAPSYRRIERGLNIFGICKKKGCKAEQKEVVVPINKNSFNLTEENFSLFCPECESIIQPKTVGFYLCQYRIYGSKVEDGKVVDFDNGYEEAKDKDYLQYFDPSSNGKITFIKLIFEISKYYEE